MSESIGDVSVRVQGDFKSFLTQSREQGIKGGEQLSQGMKIGAERNAGSIFEFLKHAASPALLATVGIGAVVGVLGEATKAALEAEQSQARLAASLKANVPNWDGNFEAIERVTEANFKYGQSDEATKDSLARLVAATHDVGEATRAQAIALDLAAFKHISLAEATNALVMVEGGRYRALASLGIQVQKGITQEEALAAVHRVTAGAADELANTTGGKLAAAQARFNDAMEKLGTSILPVVSTALDAVATAAGALGDVIGVLQGHTHEAAGALDVYNNNLDFLHQQLAAGKITFMEYRAAVQQQTDALHNGQEIAPLYASATMDAAEASREAAAAAGDHTSATDDNSNALDQSSAALYAQQQALAGNIAYFQQFTSDAGETGAALDNVAGRAIAAANGLDSTTSSIDATGNAAATAAAKLNAMAAALASAGQGYSQGVGVTGFGAGPAAVAQGLTAGVSGEANLPTEFQVPTHTTKHKVGGGGGGGKSDAVKQAEKDAKDALAAWKDAEKKRLADAKEQGDKYLAYVHQKNLKAISDDRDAALKAIEASHKQALAKIEDRRKEAQAAYEAARADIYRPVQQAEEALAQREYAQQLAAQQRSVQAAQKELADAQAAGDQARIEQAQQSLQDANDSLQNMQDQHNIDQMRTAADAQAEALDAQHKADNDKLDAEVQAENDRYDAAKKAEDDLYQLQVDNENKRYRDQTDAYDKQYKLLVEAIDKQTTTTNAKLDESVKSFYDHGVAMGANLAAGLRSTQKVVAAAAKDLADTVSAYLKTGSPARLGPLHDMSPDEMGERIGELLGIGIGRGWDRSSPLWQDKLSGLMRSGIGQAEVALGTALSTVNNVVVNNPVAETASASVFRELRILALSGVSRQ